LITAITFDVAGDFAIAAATLVLAAITGVFANSYRRRMAIELAEPRRIAYSRLYELTGIGAPSRLDLEGRHGALDQQERRLLYGELTTWYYRDGNGMLLAAKTRDVFLKAKWNLICPTDQIEPTGLVALLGADLASGKESPVDDETLRGIMSIRQLSLLRTQMKGDLAILGDISAGNLAMHERAFLHDCSVNLKKRPWKGLPREPRVEQIVEIAAKVHRILPATRLSEQLPDAASAEGGLPEGPTGLGPATE
jgi:hypothetical protein